MTVLEQLLDDWVTNYAFIGKFKEDVLNELNSKYSVSIRNNVSTTVNVKSDDLVDDAKLLPEIRSLLLQYNYEFKYSDSAIERTADKLLQLFKMYKK
jgi:hypothetical protein